MILYYYTSLIHGLASIRDLRLKISSLTTLNDPFDVLNIATETALDRVSLKEMKKKVAQKGGMICASRAWDEPLMWSHYADKHQGVCVAIDVEEDDWREVTYTERRPKLASYGVSSVDDLDQNQLEEISTIKSTSWDYEKEWRRFFFFRKQDYVTGFHFADFDMRMRPIGLIFGFRAEVSSGQIDAILEENPTLQFGFTRPGDRTFKVIIDHHRTRSEVRKANRLKYLDPKAGTLDWHFLRDEGNGTDRHIVSETLI